jgi:hypothetical protein
MGGGAGSSLKRFFGVVKEPRPYLRVAYLLTSFPAGLAYFVVLVTLGALGGGLAVTFVGIPLLVALMFAWCEAVRFEVARANVLGGFQFASPAFRGDGAHPWRWASVRARLGDSRTWRGLAWLFLAFPLGIAAFTIVVVLLSVSLGLLGFPFIAEFTADGNDIRIWRIDEWWEGTLVALAAPILFPAALHLLNFAGWGVGRVCGAVVGVSEQPAEVSRTRPVVVPRRARPRRRAWVLFGWHAGTAAAIAGLLLIINAASSPGTWWVWWAAWALAMPLAIHAGAAWRGFAGAHLGLFGIIMAGLLVIDAAYSGLTWVWWPFLGWGIPVAGHWFLARRFGGPPAVEAAVFHEAAAGTASAPAGLDDAPAAGGGAPPISVDIVMRVVRVDGHPVELTPKEFDLLALLVQNPGRPFSRDDLLDRIWKNDYEVTDRTIDTHVQRLRRKLGQEAQAIETVWGVGYRYRGDDRP